MVSRWMSVCRSIHQLPIRLSIFSFLDDNLVNFNGFSPNLVCALILLRSGLGLLMGKFCQILTAICLNGRVL